LSDGDNNGQKEFAGDDSEAKGGSSAEPIAPNLIGSSVASQTHHSAVGQVDAAVPSGSGQKSKHVPLSTKCKPSKSSAGQVMTQIELLPYRGPRSPLDLVDVDIIFRCLFEAFRHTSQAAGTGTSAGDDTHASKRAHAPSLKKVLTPR
jgi:hypothetical protein